jgi:hypothetical protein
MSTRRYKYLKPYKKNKTQKIKDDKNYKTGKRWVTSIEAALDTLNKTNSFKAAKNSLKNQALYNARKLFGNISDY